MSTAHNGGSSHDGPRLVAAILIIPVAVAIVLSLFAWPAANLAPRDLPIGIAGPAQAVAAIEQQLALAGEEAGEGENAFDVHQYADEAEARAAIEGREIYGALVATPEGATVLTASAASPLVAQLLQQAAAPQDAGAPAPQVVDVVPIDEDDPRGAVLGASLLPLVLGGMLAGIVLWTLTKTGTARTVGLIVASALAGLVVVGIAQGWLGVLGGDWWLNAGVLGLTVLAIGSVIAGFAALIGPAGIGLGALLMMLIGNPFSGVTSAPELLPTWAGVTGQYLPPGAGGTLLKSTAYFDSAGGARPALVLAAWVVFGLLCVMLGSWREHRKSARVAANVPAASPEHTSSTL